ncbi:phage putative head morphogenesis protein, SPP1 gp7 family [Streptococcus pneumoniae]|nr:phage putative head morphogenesis protein, SPP1 gp7 family [Streptococcus pneumoniae]VKN43615.1 phage putative head morphogenesis protein, SPP1 gp7 family [Streptococcus pneumoniae]VLE65850.1 phage putative head morphogenesis protein, SPP1 gp7 family [Streptococcus pneumoniae]VLX73951.1 phage putative head morphogenesis protein, SPP1 gp7 family [Streptococcus pneumoniae]VNX94512.1 phage putative head morphogenesis protein, SPP1 gp7 family [Streptococcus pneumoniae]
MKQKLIAEGYKIVKVKNTWLVDGPYKGVNTVVEKDGINFEMQYHTQESFDLKNGSLHELYEKYRDTNTSDLERMKLFKEMLDLSNGLEIPKNIERVK